MTESRARAIVLYAQYTDRLSYYDDWLDALSRSALFVTTAINICRHGARNIIKSALVDADIVILLHSTNGDTTAYLEPYAGLLADRQCPLVSFVGNELNLPGSPITAKRDVLRRIMPDFVATQLLQEAGDYLWGDLVRRAVISLPHGLNPSVFSAGPPHDKRGVDIGVRAVRYLPHLGDRDRNRVHNLFASNVGGRDLIVDIGTGRLNREGCVRFLQNSKATVSREAGSWWLERDDATIKAIRSWAARRSRGRMVMIRNDSPLSLIGHRMPWWMRAMLRRMLSHRLLRHESAVGGDLSVRGSLGDLFQGPPARARLRQVYLFAALRGRRDGDAPDPADGTVQRHFKSRRALYRVEEGLLQH